MSSQKKHIVFLPRWYPNKTDPMWGIFVKKHAEAASRKNMISVLYLAPLDQPNAKTEIAESKEGNLYTLYIYFKKPRNSILYFFRFLSLFFWGIRKINKTRKIDLLHIHILSRMGLLAYLYKLVSGTPYVITEHWSRYLPSVNTFKGNTRLALTRLIVRRAKAVLPVTKDLSNAMQSFGLKNSHYTIVPNVVDEFFFTPKMIKKKNQNKRIIHVSTFEDRSKNISGIINGIKQLLEYRQDFTMIFIGEGMDFEKMKSLKATLNIKDAHIQFLGLLEGAKLVNEYIQADFMLINSKYENMPVVINEAFACGLPVLSTNVGGISEHLDNSRGRLMPVNDSKAFIQNFNWMLDHCHDFDSDNIRKYAIEHFSYEKIAEELDTIYENALSANNLHTV